MTATSPARKILYVRIPAELHDRMAQLAKDRGVNITEVAVGLLDAQTDAAAFRQMIEAITIILDLPFGTPEEKLAAIRQRLADRQS